MARSTILPRRSGFSVIPPALTLALWRLKRTWRLLLGAGLGMLAAVMLVCAVPLFSQVAISAGLRGEILASGDTPDITVNVYASDPSADLRGQTQQTLDQVMQKNVGPYLRGTPQFNAQTPYLPITVKGAPANLQLLGADLTEAAPHLRLTAGSRLPQAGSDNEILIPQAMADALQTPIGATVALTSANATAGAKLPLLHVVGTFTLVDDRDPYWHNRDFTGQNQQNPGAFFVALLPNESLLALEPALAAVNSQGAGDIPSLVWYYHIDVDKLNANNLDAMAQAALALQTQAPNALSAIPAVERSEAEGYIFYTLIGYQHKIFELQIPVTFLLIEVLGLVLFFVSLMAEILIDRQADAIAVLRSRGGSRRQIFGALATQSLGLGVIALIAGPLLAILCVRLIAQHALTPTEQTALNVISGNPARVALGIAWYAFFAFAGSMVAMIVALNRAMGMDVLALRREAARTTRRPMWQRMNLDVVAGVIGLTGYVSYTLAVQRVDPVLQYQLAPLSMIAPVFLLIASTLLFLRLFPLLLQVGSGLAARRRGATGMLALAQMARNPRQGMRTTLLLALATGFTIFALVFVASQDQHIRDNAAFQTGADFSGGLPAVTAAAAPPLAAQTAQYRQIPGVTAASLGYVADATANSNSSGAPIHIMAVDADTYAQAAIWPANMSGQPLSAITQRLAAGRADAAAQDTVPVFVDDAAWSALQLAQNPHFTVSVPNYPGGAMHFIAVGHVAHLPGVYNSGQDLGSGVGLLVDYQSYSAVFGKDTGGLTIPQNYAWLRTADDAASLASARAALGSGDLRLSALQDRRAIIAAALANPLEIDLESVLGLAAATAIVLAIIGALVSSWLSARTRLTNFAVLRALGTGPRQLARILLSEQGLLYGTAIVLGAIIGAILAASVLPSLIFANFLTSGDGSILNLDVPPLQTVVPWTAMALILGGLVAIFAVSLALMTRVVARPSVSQTLRLNED